MPVRAGSGAPVLLLVPTELEARALSEAGGIEPGVALLRVCGFGPLAAAAFAAERIARLSPARVVLTGIAGSYDPDALPVGSAERFRRVGIDGLETAGFEQAPGIARVLDLAEAHAGTSRADLLLTVFAPSRTPAEASERRSRHAGASAEDMEAYGVAVACALAGVPLSVVRGISNAAGDGDRKRWRIRDAMAQVRALLAEDLAR